MSTLTIEAIRNNPWNVLTDPLPTNPSPVLLRAAFLATDYCCRSEDLIKTAAREGDYQPEGWSAGETSPDAHEESESRWFAAQTLLQAIEEIYERNYGVKLQL